MKSFEYTITDSTGLHARPAGLLVKAASGFSSSVTIKKGEKSADAKKIFALMGLGVKFGETITAEISGEDEEKACEELKNFFEANL